MLVTYPDFGSKLNTTGDKGVPRLLASERIEFILMFILNLRSNARLDSRLYYLGAALWVQVTSLYSVMQSDRNNSKTYTFFEPIKYKFRHVLNKK